MAIRHVESILADPEYIRQLEIELRELRKIAEQAFQMAKAAQGR